MAEDRTIGVAVRSDPGTTLFAIAPSDATPLSLIPRAIWTGAGGTIVVQGMDDTTATTLTNVPAGIILPIRVSFVKATGTTATGLVGIA